MLASSLNGNGPRGAGRDGPEGMDYVARARRQILLELRGGEPHAIGELPHRWPLTREHLAYLVDRLTEEGLIEYLPNGGSTATRVRLTAAGRHAAALEVER